MDHHWSKEHKRPADKMKTEGWLRKMIVLSILIAFAGAAALLTLNSRVKTSAKERIISPEETARLQQVDCILVLGCGVRADGTPSPMLTDRLERSIELYEGGASGKLLMSGDHGSMKYDEVNVMKQHAVNRGVPSENVFMDHAGFSTYESIYRAKEIFKAEKIIVVTQGYHLYRALYIAAGLGVEAYGVGADRCSYAGQQFREAREFLARAKDFFTVIFKPKPRFLGEIIPVSGDGDLTND